MFDDYLGLGSLDLDRYRLLVFQGDSGSGKSTALEYLSRRYEAERSVTIVKTGFARLGETPTGSFVVYDELIVPKQLKDIAALLKRANTVAVASHLHPARFLPFRLRYPAKFWWTDRDSGKILRYLKRKGVETSEEAVLEYCKIFGATYTDVDIILECNPTRSFDAALRHFMKFRSIHRNGPCLNRLQEDA